MKNNQIITVFISFFLMTWLLPTNTYAQLKQITTILQDSENLIWIASQRKIASYDGYQFKEIDLNTSEQMTPLIILDMEFTTDQELLIATLKHGLLSYPINQTTKPKAIEFIPEKAVFSITKTSNGIWAATKEGLYFLDGSKSKFHKFPKSKKFIKKIVKKDNEIIIAAVNNLISFNIKQNTFTDLPYPHNDKTQLILDLHVNDNGVLFISSDQGVFEQETNTSEWSLNDQNPAHCVGMALASNEDTLWIGTLTQGLVNNASHSKNQSKHFLTSNSNIASDHVTALFKDQDNNIWMGFNDGSLSISTPNSLTLEFNNDQSNYSGCENFNPVLDFSENSNNHLWAATAKGVIKIDHLSRSCEIIKFSNKNSPYRHKTSIPNIVFTDNNNKLWAYYQQFGLVQINDSEQSIQQIHHPINKDEASLRRFIAQTNSNTFIFADLQGLVSYNLKLKKLTKLKPVSEELENSIVSDSIAFTNDKYLLATNQGVATYDHTGFKSSPEIQSQLPTKNIKIVFKDSLNNIWIGTAESGLFRFTEEKMI